MTNDLNDVDFATLVRMIQQARGCTQEDLARELDVTVGTMNGWENARHRPVKVQRKRLLRLAAQIGVRPPQASALAAKGAK